MLHRLILLFFFYFGLLHSLSAREKDTIRPLSPCVSEIFVPSSFSGNGDGVNDYLIPLIAGETYGYKFTIYNRWGNVVFETDRYTVGWDGSSGDRSAVAGVYFWIIVFTCKGSAEEYSLQGNVTLIR